MYAIGTKVQIVSVGHLAGHIAGPLPTHLVGQTRTVTRHEHHDGQVRHHLDGTNYLFATEHLTAA